MPTWVEPIFEQLWSFIAVAFAVYSLGGVSKRIAERLGWRKFRTRDVRVLVETVAASANRDTSKDVPSADIPLPDDASWYDITLRMHPLIAGALFGLLPIPALHVIDTLVKDEPNSGLAARCAWFMLAGALSGQIYEIVKFAFGAGRERLLNLIGLTQRPNPPAAAPPPLPEPKHDTVPEPVRPASDDEETKP